MAAILQQSLSALKSAFSLGTSWSTSLPQNAINGLDWTNCSIHDFPGIARSGFPELLWTDLRSVPGLSCANLSVPADWNDRRNRDTITIGMTRLKSNNSEADSLGSLFYNPGGPGIPASSAIFGAALGATLYATFFTKNIREHYDIIGHDPRGIGMSTPVRCDPDIFNERVSLMPTTEQGFEKLVDRNRALGESCLNGTGPFLAHVDTTNAAKDIEAIRVALGDEKLNWLGMSYGTQLGGAYAELFPETVGRMVLDGLLDHSQSESSNLHAESATYENVLNQFFSWCNTTATAEECPFKDRDFPRIFDELIMKANEKPIPAPGCITDKCRSDVTGEEILLAVEPTGRRVTFWPELASALNDAVNGDATRLSAPLAKSETDGNFAAYAIQCVDWEHDAKSLSDVVYKEQMGASIAPHTKGVTQTWSIQMTCIGWSTPVTNPKHYLDPITMAKAPPILLVNAYHDPETSYVWAVGMQEQIPTGVLLTRNGTGHTSYALGGETTAAIDAFLINGTLPEHNLVLQT